MPGDILACAAAELLQPYDAAKPGACSRDSPVGIIHMRLLDLVSHASVMHVFFLIHHVLTAPCTLRSPPWARATLSDVGDYLPAGSRMSVRTCDGESWLLSCRDCCNGVQTRVTAYAPQRFKCGKMLSFLDKNRL